MSGYCVAEWLPQMVMFVMSATGAPDLRASCAIARLWSSRIMAVKRSRRHVGRVALRDQRVRVRRVAHHEHAHDVVGVGVDGLALRA